MSVTKSQNRIEERQQQWIEKFAPLASWDEKYKRIIEEGKKLPPFPESFRTEDNKVKGCQSQVWLHASLNSQGEIEFVGDSDALIVKGLVALILSLYSPSTPDEILNNPPEVFSQLGLNSHLSPSRANGLMAMLRQIRHYAVAFKIILESKKKL